MKTINLKTWPVFFQAIKCGDKMYEVREIRDRGFAIGDTLLLEEWEPKTESYTGDCITVVITHMLTGETWGVKDGYCVMGIRRDKMCPTCKGTTTMEIGRGDYMNPKETIACTHCHGTGKKEE